MTCAWRYTRPNGSTYRCPDQAADDSDYCGFHARNWAASFAATEAESDEYAEATEGRNLFLDRLEGRTDR
jgi:hypothetical protein